jgi:NADPH2:quinone reductase
MRTRRAVITRRGGPEVLAIVEDELPEPGPGQVQVAILTSGVAFGDVLKRYSLVPWMPRFPYTPGYDLVGVVERVGPEVERWKGGDRVAAPVMNGANAERANVAADALVAVPPAVGDAEAGSGTGGGHPRALIGAEAGRMGVFVIPADEEIVIAGDRLEGTR